MLLRSSLLKTSAMLLLVNALLSGGGLCRGENANTAENDILGSRLDPVMMKLMRMYDIPGMAVGVVQDGKVVHEKGYGVRKVGSEEPVTSKTIFHLASISKTFVATAVMQLVEGGYVGLDDPVVKHLPYFKLDDERYKKVTVNQMLTHVSGMPDVEDYEWDKPKYDDKALEDYVRSLADRKLLFGPGKKFAYSNMAFEVLGDLVAKVSGVNFDDYIEEFILDPLGMELSTFMKPQYLPDDWASPHVAAPNALICDIYPYNRIHGPSSTLHSSASDMCRWAMANLNKGVIDGERILETSSYDLLWKPYKTTGMGIRNNEIGLSWFLGGASGDRVISHSGGDMGFCADLVLLPEKSTAVIVLCNLIPVRMSIVTNVILSILSGEEPDLPKPAAVVQVCITLKEKGEDAAVERWKRLKEKHGDEYDFDLSSIVESIFILLDMEKGKDAMDLIKLTFRLEPDISRKEMASYVEFYLKEKPDNRVAEDLLKAINEKQD